MRNQIFCVFLVFCYVADARAESSVQNFSFRNYDALESKSEKQTAASKDLIAAFPPGSKVAELESYVVKHRGYCQKRTYIPPVDRYSIVGDHIYCEVNYVDPQINNPILWVKWSIDIKYNKDLNAIEELRVFWSRFGMGG